MINTKEQAIQFLTTMQYLYPLLNPEDDPIDVEDCDGNRVINDEQRDYLNKCFDEVYDVLDDPCEIIVQKIRPKMAMFNLVKYKSK